MNLAPEYPALLFRQSPAAAPLVLLCASAIEIDQWVGIPQKTRIADGETLGFQRDDNPERIDQIAQFYGEAQNVIHNPLLCAIRQKVGVDVIFTPNADAQTDITGNAVTGTLKISVQDRSSSSLLDLIREVRQAIEARVSGLADRPLPEILVAKLRTQYENLHHDLRNSDKDEDDSSAGDDRTSDNQQGIEEALFDESHVTDFWDALKAREELLIRLGSQFTGDDFLGFNRTAMEAYLKPLILVDGQHRLLGALQAARDAVDQDPQVTERIGRLIAQGTPENEIKHQLLMERARHLPISLLMDHHPGEHVFQFVVVNQKATPVRPALLATIISTSLSESELEPISDRLENAGVPLKSSRAISFFARHPSSPFAGRVARGLSDEGTDLLPWTVLGQLVAMFRDLNGARFYHDYSKMDYADNWKRRQLERSKLVDAAQGSAAAYEAWRDPDGPWKSVFIAFWSAVRDTLGNPSNPDAGNFWGRPRTSNLFNKPSLATLATDFFAYLVETRQTIDAANIVPALVDDWLVDVDKNYFARDWKLTGVKKDATGTRKQWSKIWFSYRRDPKMLPRVAMYSTLYKEN
ncbi:hypothetical protein [Achromobacter xylosoxidans]